MREWLDFFAEGGFMPHGHCYLWKPALLWLHATSDAVVALSYTIIPITLGYFVRKRSDIPFNWVFWCFATFIVSCGLTHYMEVWTVWNPDYWLAGGIKAVTAAVSLPTALLLVRFVPEAIALPSSAQLQSAYDALAESEAWYRETIDSSLDAFIILEPVRGDDGKPIDLAYADMNAAAFELIAGLKRTFGLPVPASRTELKGRRLTESYLKGVLDDRIAAYLEVARDRAPQHREFRITLPDGTHRWHETQISPMREGVTVSIRDVTESREAERRVRAALEEKEVLLKEVHHRVKNNLQIITSLLNLQAEAQADPRVRDAFAEARYRVQSIALVHERLYRSKDLANVDLGDYLQNLATMLVGSLGPGTVRLEVEAEPLVLPLDTAIPCGLVANELITNAIKHAFPGGRPGKVTVALHRRGDRAELIVADDGVGFPEGLDLRTVPSLGLQLVSTLTHQLGGTVHLERAAGTRFEVSIPITSGRAAWPES